MAHFAELDSFNKVIRVIVIDNEHESDGLNYIKEVLKLDGTWLQTSYNANIRGKFAAIGDTYDASADRFIVASPYPSWILDSSYNWNPPTPYPEDGKGYYWNESSLEWIENE
jgi:hypothetical protein